MGHAGGVTGLQLLHPVPALVRGREDLADPIGRDRHRPSDRALGNPVAPVSTDVGPQDLGAELHVELGEEPPAARKAPPRPAVVGAADPDCDALLRAGVLPAGAAFSTSVPRISSAWASGPARNSASVIGRSACARSTRGILAPALRGGTAPRQVGPRRPPRAQLAAPLTFKATHASTRPRASPSQATGSASSTARCSSGRRGSDGGRGKALYFSRSRILIATSSASTAARSFGRSAARLLARIRSSGKRRSGTPSSN